MERKIRLYEIIDGEKYYLADDFETMTNKKHAGLFPASAWENWASYADLQREDLPEDEQLRLIGAPMLPLFETL